MSEPLNSATIVRQVLATAQPLLSDLPDPFDYTPLESGDIRFALRARLRGKLAQLRETDCEIVRRFEQEQASLQQTWISRGSYNISGYDCYSRELSLKEEKERSTARERWFSELSDDEKLEFDRYCRAVAGPEFESILPASTPPCLHGALARLALETAGIPRAYNVKRAERQESLHSRGLTNPTVISSFLDRLFADELEAKARLVERWFRELTPEQEAALDGRWIPNMSTTASAGPTKATGKPGECVRLDKLTPSQERLVAYLQDKNVPTPIRDAMKHMGKSATSKTQRRSFMASIRRTNKRLADYYPDLENDLDRKAKTIALRTQATRATK